MRFTSQHAIEEAVLTQAPGVLRRVGAAETRARRVISQLDAHGGDPGRESVIFGLDGEPCVTVVVRPVQRCVFGGRGYRIEICPQSRLTRYGSRAPPVRAELRDAHYLGLAHSPTSEIGASSGVTPGTIGSKCPAFVP